MNARAAPEPVLLSWSGGKDSALALVRLREQPAVEVVGLLTTVTSGYDRVSIHGVRRALLHRQADELGLALHEIMIEPDCSNDSYEAAWRSALEQLPARMRNARVIAFGDIFLGDVRRYRERMAHELGFDALFPLWSESTRALADEILQRQIVARLVCVDTESLAAEYAGRLYDRALLDALPVGIDPCGERGEFHTFVSAGPGFRAPVAYRSGAKVLRDDRFMFCDLLDTAADSAAQPRLATAADIPAIRALIEASSRVLSAGFYTAEQIEACLTHVFGVDSQLIADGTYYVIDAPDGIAAAGGWSGRRTLFGGDQMKTAEDPRLDPATDAARIRAYFVHPHYARRGLARRLYQECAAAAWQAGFRDFELMATLPGEPVYRALGFVATEPVAIDLPGGVAIPFVRMRRPIDPPVERTAPSIHQS